jgi:competence protein ComEC
MMQPEGALFIVSIAPAVSRGTMAWIARLAVIEAGRGVLWLPVGMTAGALIYLNLRFEPPLTPCLCALALLGALALLLPGRVLKALVAGLFSIALGFSSGVLAAARVPPPLALPFRAVVLTASVRAVDLLPEGARRLVLEQVRLDPEAPPLPRFVRVRLRPGDDTPAAVGDRVQLRALLRGPAPPAYPGAWDLQRDAYFTGLGGGGVALGRVTILATAPPAGPLGWLRRLRDTVAARIVAALPGSEGAIAATLMTGIGGAIPEADRAAFRDSGLAHLLAVAGLHIGIVMGLFFGLTRFLLALSTRAALFWPCKAIAAIVALAAGGAYLAMTGAHVPIMRSFAMAALFTLAAVLGRRALSLRGLGVAMAGILLIAPWEAGGVSFQMSFSAVLALIAGYEALRPWLRDAMREQSRGRHLQRHVIGLAVTSALAGAASAPFAAYHFGRVQSWFVLANMVAVPLTALWVMPCGLLALALMPFGLERLALVPMGWGIAAILWIGRHTAALPGAVWLVPHMPALGLAILSLGLAWLGIWRSPLRLLGLAPIALGLASPWLVRPPDMLVAPDARLIAISGSDGVFVEAAPGAAKFVREAWAQFYGVPDLAPLPSEGKAASYDCTADRCILAPRDGMTEALLIRKDGQPPPEDCEGAALIVSPEPIRTRCGETDAAQVDRFTVWREGAAMIWLRADGALVVTDRAIRGRRPWVAPP